MNKPVPKKPNPESSKPPESKPKQTDLINFIQLKNPFMANKTIQGSVQIGEEETPFQLPVDEKGVISIQDSQKEIIEKLKKVGFEIV